MADEQGLKITVKMRHNALTGKKDITIEYEESDDVPQWKHDKQHKEIVEKLLGKGILKPDELGNVKVEQLKPVGRRGPAQQGQATPGQRLTERQ